MIIKSPPFWPDRRCGSGHLLQTALRYNKEELARFRSQIRNGESTFAMPPEALSSLYIDDKARLDESCKRAKAFDYILYSLAADACTVDTLHLFFIIRPGMVGSDHLLKVKLATGKRKNRVLWQEKTGKKIEGVAALWKQKGIRIKIKPLNKRLCGVGSIGCFIQLTLPSWLGKVDNAWPTDPNFSSLVIDSVQEKLTMIGITADLREAKVCRCDINRNMVLDESCASYMSVLRAMSIPRTKRMLYPETGCIFYNKSYSLKFYDKIAELKAKGVPTGHLPRNLMRVEWSIKGARNVTGQLKVTTVQNLLDRWMQIESIFVAFLAKSAFRYDVEILKKPRSRGDCRLARPTLAQIRNFHRWCKKKQIKLPYTASQLDGLLRTGGPYEYYEAIKKVSGMHPKHADDAGRRMSDAYWHEIVMTDPDFVRRYEELKSKSAGGYCWPTRRFTVAQSENSSPAHM